MDKNTADTAFFRQEATVLAPALLGQHLIRRWPDGSVERFTIAETEAYCGEEDKGCHCSRGRTPRTEMMYKQGGLLYVYLIYGMHWMLNIVSGQENHPEAIFIRGLKEINGPGRLTKRLKLDGSWNGKSLNPSSGLWIELTSRELPYTTAPRIGIAYAGNYWANMPWRYILKT